jgi:hypothetical protein
MNDDWSYVQSARVLAKTGHIVYNGWATAILGWQLYLGALFARLFGPSFTAIRASTLLVALLTAFLTHRTLMRCGVNSRNAVIGTLALVLSPIFLPLALIFMSDMGGLFCVLLCLYACLRALQAQTGRAVLAWLAFAALSNAVGGTVRQIAWLGVLVMFPCTVWLLRRRPHILLMGALLYAVSVGIVFRCNHWFLQQPYSVSVPLMLGHPNKHHLVHFVLDFLSFCLSGAMFLLPILLAFVPAISFRNRRMATLLILSGVGFAAIFSFLTFSRFVDALYLLTAPFLGDYVNQFGLVGTFGIIGSPPVVLSFGLRLLITAVVLLGIFCFLILLFASRKRAPVAQIPAPISRNSLLVLLIPFVLSSVTLLLFQDFVGTGKRTWLFDRYLLPLLPIALILLLRFYQDRVKPNLPPISGALVLALAFYAVAGTHDAFSKYRARQAAVSELRGAGVPDNAIDAGFDHNAMTQIERFGYINDPHVRMPGSADTPHPLAGTTDCQTLPDAAPLTPVMVPGYTLSYDPKACGGLSRFAPVTYSEWLAFRMVPIYIVNAVRPASGQR